MSETALPPRAMLIEDDTDDATLTIRALRACGIEGEIDVAKDGIEALARLIGEGEGEPNLPDIVLLDLKLPQVSGLEVLKQIRSHPRTHALPVVVITSSDDQGDLAASCRLGANGYIRKDADSDKFRESIQRLVDQWLEPSPYPLLVLT